MTVIPDGIRSTHKHTKNQQHKNTKDFLVLQSTSYNLHPTIYILQSTSYILQSTTTQKLVTCVDISTHTECSSIHRMHLT